MVNWNMIGAIILPSIGGWISALSMSGQIRSDDGTAWYEIIKKPSWTPPNWVFAPVWIILYSAMGYASYMIYEDCDGKSNSAALPLALYAGQLLLNWTWTPIFFKFHQMGWALTHMCVLDTVTTACIWSFFMVNKKTLLFMSPYVGWLVFATCLNYTIWQLNKDNEKMLNWSRIGAMILPNVGGWAGALTMAGQVRSANGTAWYETIKKPRWTPPNWVFGPAWTILYTGMGLASYMIYEDCGGFTDDAVIPLTLFGGQLLLNWTWTPVFFRFHQIGLALLHMFALDAAATACTISFFAVNRNTLYLMAPYLCWLTFATCLNYSIWRLNKDGVNTD